MIFPWDASPPLPLLSFLDTECLSSATKKCNREMLEKLLRSGVSHVSRRRLFRMQATFFFCFLWDARLLVCSSIQLELRRFTDIIVRKMNSASASAMQFLI